MRKLLKQFGWKLAIDTSLDKIQIGSITTLKLILLLFKRRRRNLMGAQDANAYKNSIMLIVVTYKNLSSTYFIDEF